MGADFRGDPAERDARGPRPGPERLLPRPLPRPAVRPLRGAVHRHRERPRHDPGAAARPDGGDPARRLHARREAPHRRNATWSRARSPRTALRPSQIGFTDAALVRSSRSTRARPASAAWSARSAPSAARSPAMSPRGGSERTRVGLGKRARELLGRRRFFAEQRRRTRDAGCRHRARLDSGRRRGAVHRGDGDAGQRRADDHRPARRGDARVGPGRAFLRPRPRGRLDRGLPEDWFAQHDIHVHVPGRRRAQGRALGRAWRWPQRSPR